MVVFILRHVEDWEYASREHKMVAQPKPERAESLGISLDTLREATSKLRPKQNPMLTKSLITALMRDTQSYWQNWIGKSKYSGRWREAVHRSALVLKMLVFEETGAIVAAPTFSLPEHIGGARNWPVQLSYR